MMPPISQYRSHHYSCISFLSSCLQTKNAMHNPYYKPKTPHRASSLKTPYVIAINGHHQQQQTDSHLYTITLYIAS